MENRCLAALDIIAAFRRIGDIGSERDMLRTILEDIERLPRLYMEPFAYRYANLLLTGDGGHIDVDEADRLLHLIAKNQETAYGQLAREQLARYQSETAKEAPHAQTI